ncbi:unnamed protein product [Arabidopsis arenosa]|uniref:Uncharacterized protein n=1 Tax=Arabidopsis arenosa TaxID=38785 RepID=A0A8S2AGX1_ARAAE|nr:unnamed protein product [Arabidopsis arenosa]
MKENKRGDLDFDKIITLAQKDKMEAVIADKLGDESCKIFRFLSKEQTFLQNYEIKSAMGIRKDLQDDLMTLWREGFLTIQKEMVTAVDFPVLYWNVDFRKVRRNVYYLVQGFTKEICLEKDVWHGCGDGREICVLRSCKQPNNVSNKQAWPVHVRPPQQNTSTHGTVFSSCMFPILGEFLADSILGRFKTVLLTSFIYLLGNVMLPLSVTVVAPGMREKVFFLALYVTAVGEGGHKLCVMTFAADQFGEGNPEEKASKTSFFNIWYIAIVLASSIAVLALIFIQVFYFSIFS